MVCLGNCSNVFTEKIILCETNLIFQFFIGD